MNVGSFFTIGSTHIVCEDYALHGLNDINEMFAIVSDGCSNGGVRVHTDFGSRLLCKSAEKHLTLLPHNVESFKERVITTAELQVQTYFNMPLACLTATLGVALQVGDSIHTMLIGDGFIGGKRRDGMWVVYEFEFEQAPYYLKYTLHDEEQLYFDRFGSLGTRTKWSFLTPDDVEEEVVNFDLRADNHPKHFGLDFSMSDYEFVFITSDGLSKFHTKEKKGVGVTNVPIPVPQVVPVLFDFRGFQHNFVERQCHWAMNTTKPRSISRVLGEHQHFDDMGIGVIYCGEKEET